MPARKKKPAPKRHTVSIVTQIETYMRRADAAHKRLDEILARVDEVGRLAEPRGRLRTDEILESIRKHDDHLVASQSVILFGVEKLLGEKKFHRLVLDVVLAEARTVIAEERETEKQMRADLDARRERLDAREKLHAQAEIRLTKVEQRERDMEVRRLAIEKRERELDGRTKILSENAVLLSERIRSLHRRPIGRWLTRGLPVESW